GPGIGDRARAVVPQEWPRAWRATLARRARKPRWASGSRTAATSSTVATQKRGVPGSSRVEPKNENANERSGAASATATRKPATGTAAKPAAQKTGAIGPIGCAVTPPTTSGPAAPA